MARVAKFLILCSTVAVLATGCGEPSPVDKCQDLVETACGRVASCGNATLQAECVQDITQGAGSCSVAKSISDGYDTCIADLQAADCSSLVRLAPTGHLAVTLPSTCHDAILFDGP